MSSPYSGVWTQSQCCAWRQAPPDPTSNTQPPAPAPAPSPQRDDIPHPQSQPLPPRSGSPRPVTTTATHAAAHPTPAVSPADWVHGMGEGEVTHCLFRLCQIWPRSRPSHQALAHEPSVRAWLRMWPHGPGKVSRLTPVSFMESLLTILSMAPHLRPVCLGRPYQEHMAPDNLTPTFIGTRKPLHHNKVMVPREADCKYVKEFRIV